MMAVVCTQTPGMTRAYFVRYETAEIGPDLGVLQPLVRARRLRNLALIKIKPRCATVQTQTKATLSLF